MNTTFSGRVAVVTGAAGDIGQAAVRLLLQRGATVIGVDRDEAGLQRLAADPSNAAHLTILTADVCDEAAIAEVFDASAKRFGGIDIVFNNAGIEGGPNSTVKRIRDYPLDAFRQIIEVNVVGVFLVMKHAIPHLAARGGGAIVNSCSLYGVKGAAGQSAYVASKHAVLGLTRTAAAECGADHIRINCIGPAVIRGGMMNRLMAAWQADSGVEVTPADFVHPLQRWCEPDEVAALVAFLVSDEARFITGSFYAIDGGLNAV